MPKNEEGEVEVILGNKQLLFVFFVVAVLLGVFFTMGYVLGRNVGGPAAVAEVPKTESKPLVVERASTGAAAVTKESAAPATETKPAAAETQQPVASAVEAKPAETKHKETAKEKEAKKKEAAKKERKTEDEPERKPAPAGATTPSAGMYYLQLAAVGESEAQVYVSALKKKSFHAIYVPVPGKSLYRALAGPFKDSAEVSQARQDLNKAGFDGYGAYLRKF